MCLQIITLYQMIQGRIGAINGTHVDAHVPKNKKVAYIERCGSFTQNIMVACDFNICFTFVMVGWEYSTHDSRIFHFATQNHQYNLAFLPQVSQYLSELNNKSCNIDCLFHFQERKYYLVEI